MKMFLFIALSVIGFSSDESCYATLMNVEKYTTEAIDTNSTTYVSVALHYVKKAQIECVTHATSMDATRHLGIELEKFNDYITF